MQLVSANIGGNLHSAVNYVNEIGLADSVICMDYSGGSTIVVFRVDDKVAPKVRAFFGTLPEYRANPKFVASFNA